MPCSAVGRYTRKHHASTLPLRKCAAALAMLFASVPAVPAGAIDYCVYVVNPGGGSVTAASGREEIRIFVGGNPSTIAITPDQRTAYVGIRGSSADDLTLIDLPTKSVRRGISLPSSNVLDVEVHPSGAFLYAGTDDGLYVVDTVTDEILARLPKDVGAAPIVFAPDGRYAYVGRTVMDTMTHTVAGELPLDDIAGLAVSPDGAFAIATNGRRPGGLRIVNLFTRTVTADIAVDELPTSIVIQPDGTKAHIGHEIIAISTLTTLDLRTFKVESRVHILGGGVGAALSPDGYVLYMTGGYQRNALFVVEAGSGRIGSQREVAGGAGDIGVAVEAGGCRLPTPTSTATAAFDATPTSIQGDSPPPMVTPRPQSTPIVTEPLSIVPGGAKSTPTATGTPTATTTVAAPH